MTTTNSQAVVARDERTKSIPGEWPMGRLWNRRGSCHRSPRKGFAGSSDLSAQARAVWRGYSVVFTAVVDPLAQLSIGGRGIVPHYLPDDRRPALGFGPARIGDSVSRAGQRDRSAQLLCSGLMDSGFGDPCSNESMFSMHTDRAWIRLEELTNDPALLCNL